MPEPEEVPKNQSLEVKILPKPVEVQKFQKKQSFGGLRLGGLKNFVFFGTSSGFGQVFVFKENIARTWGGTKKTKKTMSGSENLAKT